jgi:hypothetical protein
LAEHVDAGNAADGFPVIFSSRGQPLDRAGGFPAFSFSGKMASIWVSSMTSSFASSQSGQQ